MTPQEQEMIDGLISRIRSTPIQNKDTQAEQYIQQNLTGYPDALYVLVQTVLVQQYGLQQAQSQINELKQQVQTLQNTSQEGAKGSGGSFLSHLFGTVSSNQGASSTQGNPSFQPVSNPGSPSYGSGGYPPPPPPAYPAQPYPSSSGGGFFGGGSGGGGFLRGAMQTAAGVAAGEMMFQGMEDLFHGFGGHERGFSGGGGETVVNNYYDEDRTANNRDLSSGDDRGFYNPNDDASRSDLGSNDSGVGSTEFTDTSSDDASNNDLNFGDNGDNGFDMGGGDDFSSDNS